MKEYKFKLPIGDWSDDGHGKCDKFTVHSNVDPKELIDPYVEALEKSGLKDVCSEYEDRSIPQEFWDKNPFLNPENYAEGWEDSWFVENPKRFAQLILDVVNHYSGTELELEPESEMIEFNNWFGQSVKGGVSVIPSMGYGLYY